MKNMSRALVALSVMAALYGEARSDNRGDTPPARPANEPVGSAPKAAPAMQDKTFMVHTFPCPATVNLGVRDAVVETKWHAEPSWAVGKVFKAVVEPLGSPRYGWPRCDYKYTYQHAVQPGAPVHIWTNPALIAGLGTRCQKAASLSFKCAKHALDGTW